MTTDSTHKVPDDMTARELATLTEARIRKLLLEPDYPENGAGSFCRNHKISNLVVAYVDAEGNPVRIHQCDDASLAAARREQ